MGWGAASEGSLFHKAIPASVAELRPYAGYKSSRLKPAFTQEARPRYKDESIRPAEEWAEVDIHQLRGVPLGRTL